MLGFSLVLLAIDMQAHLISTPYMIGVPRFKGTRQALFTGSSFIHQLALSAITSASLAIGAFVLLLGVGPQGLARVMCALVVAISFIMLREFARRVCFAWLRMEAALLVDSFVAVGQIGGILILAHLDALSASNAYWVIGAVCGLVAFSWLIWIRKRLEWRIGQALADFKNNWSLAKWIFASGSLWTLSVNLYPWILTAFHGTASSGVWAACIGIVAIVNPVLLGLSNILGPMISYSFVEGGHVKLRQFTLRASVVFSALLFPFCLILLVYGESLMTFIYGYKYAGNGLVVSVLALSLVISVPRFTCSRALFAMGRADLDFKASFVALLVLVTLGIWLVRTWGLVGAACGLLITNILVLVPQAVVCMTLNDTLAQRREACKMQR